MTRPSLSIVIPCHNEQEILPSTIQRLNVLVTQMLQTCISSCEFVLVNNGSTDDTIGTMQGLVSEVATIVIVDLRRNFGYQGSISAGLHHAAMDVVVTIDSDLQDDPEKIPEMIELHTKGYDLVLGIRSGRTTDSFFKRVFSQLYYRILAWLGVESVYNHGEFRLMSRALVEEFKQLAETNRYIRALILQLDSKYATVSYERTSRELGTTKFTPARLLNLAVDGITSFSSVPIRLVTVSGIFLSALAILSLLYVVGVLLFTTYNVPGWASLATISLFFSGIQTFFLGVVGEYIAKIYTETKRRPVFTVRQVIRK